MTDPHQRHLSSQGGPGSQGSGVGGNGPSFITSVAKAVANRSGSQTSFMSGTVGSGSASTGTANTYRNDPYATRAFGGGGHDQFTAIPPILVPQGSPTAPGPSVSRVGGQGQNQHTRTGSGPYPASPLVPPPAYSYYSDPTPQGMAPAYQYAPSYPLEGSSYGQPHAGGNQSVDRYGNDEPAVPCPGWNPQGQDQDGSCLPEEIYAGLGIQVHQRRRSDMGARSAAGSCLGHVDERLYAEHHNSSEEAPPYYAGYMDPQTMNTGRSGIDDLDLDDCQSAGAATLCFRRPQQLLQQATGSHQRSSGGSSAAMFACAPQLGGHVPPPASLKPVGRPPFDSALLVENSSEITHSDLNGFCKYLAFPPASEIAEAVAKLLPPPPPPGSAPQPPTTPNRPIFFGQVLFTTTREQLTWLIHELVGVTTTIVTNHSPGCFTCYFKSLEDCDAVLTLNKKVLFDRSGVWLASTEEQMQLLYVAGLSQANPKSANANSNGVRLPRGPLVVEVPMHKGQSGPGRGGVAGRGGPVPGQVRNPRGQPPAVRARITSRME